MPFWNVASDRSDSRMEFLKIIVERVVRKDMFFDGGLEKCMLAVPPTLRLQPRPDQIIKTHSFAVACLI